MASTKIQVKKADLKEGKPVGLDVNGKKVMLVLFGGKPYAINSVCSHRGGPLEKGAMNGNVVTCPWHSAQYNVENGNVIPQTPWGKHQDSYKVKVDPDGSIWVDA